MYAPYNRDCASRDSIVKVMAAFYTTCSDTLSGVAFYTTCSDTLSGVAFYTTCSDTLSGVAFYTTCSDTLSEAKCMLWSHFEDSNLLEPMQTNKANIV